MMQYDLGRNTYFCAKKSTVIKFKDEQRHETKLDNLESSLLQLFIDNVGTTLSKHDLMTVWRAQYVMEHSVTRVISTLRKKLGSNEQKSTFIKTIPRAGYQFVGQAKVIQLDPEERAIKVSDKLQLLYNQWKNLVIAFQAILLVCILSYLYVGSRSQLDTLQHSSYKPIIEISDNQTIKASPATTDDGEWIVYSAKSDNSSWFLKFVSTHTGETWQFSESNYNHSAPAWLNNNNLVFKRWSNDLCEVRKISFDDFHSIKSNELITTCNSTMQSKGLAVLSDSEILLSDSDALTSPLELQKVTIETGAKKVLLTKNKGHGIYRIFTSPNKEYVATLSSPDWFATIIQIYNANDFSSHIWQRTIDYPLFSVSLSNDYITFKNEHGGLSTVEFLSGVNNKQLTPLLLTRAIYSPVYSPSGFLFTEGEMYARIVSFVDLESNQSTKLVDSKNNSIAVPTLVDADTLLYASNQTGINQIWQYQISSQKHIQISKFSEPYFVYQITLNNQKDTISISTNKGIILAEYKNGLMGKVITVVNGKYPAFWKNKLIFNRFREDRNTILTYSLDSNKRGVLISNGAYKTVVDNGKLYYSKFHKSGIWQYVEEGEDELIYAEYKPYPPESWDIHQGALYIGNQEESAIFRIELGTNNISNFSMGHCSTVNIFANNQCIATQVAPSVNRLLKFTYDLR